MIKASLKYSWLLLIFMFQNAMAQSDWKLEKEQSGIKIYTKPVSSSSFNAFKATMTVDESVESLLAVLYDLEGMKSWAYKVKDASLLNKSGDTLQIYYAEVAVPFPYTNRDGVYSNSVKWDSKTKTLDVEITLLDDYKGAKEGLVRISGKGYWKAQVLPSGKLEITFEMAVNPGGGIPGWMANIFAADSPYYTMLELQKVIKNEKYQNKSFGFIQ